MTTQCNTVLGGADWMRHPARVHDKGSRLASSCPQVTAGIPLVLTHGSCRESHCQPVQNARKRHVLVTCIAVMPTSLWTHPSAGSTIRGMVELHASFKGSSTCRRQAAPLSNIRKQGTLTHTHPQQPQTLTDALTHTDHVCQVLGLYP